MASEVATELRKIRRLGWLILGLLLLRFGSEEVEFRGFDVGKYIALASFYVGILIITALGLWAIVVGLLTWDDPEPEVGGRDEGEPPRGDEAGQRQG